MAMHFIRNFPLFTIVLSLFSSVLCMMLDGRTAKRYTVCYECFLIALACAVLWYVSATGESFTYVMGEFPAPWGNEIRAGILEALLAVVFLIILLCSVLGGWRFLLIDVEHSKINLYFTLIHLLTAALMALAMVCSFLSVPALGNEIKRNLDATITLSFGKATWGTMTVSNTPRTSYNVEIVATAEKGVASFDLCSVSMTVDFPKAVLSYRAYENRVADSYDDPDDPDTKHVMENHKPSDRDAVNQSGAVTVYFDDSGNKNHSVTSGSTIAVVSFLLESGEQDDTVLNNFSIQTEGDYPPRLMRNDWSNPSNPVLEIYKVAYKQ